ncbi:MAG: hypothetical protein AAFQ04_01690 [Pseudomonadota bacterium]
MARVTAHYTFGARILMFLLALFFGYLTLLGLSQGSQIGAAFMGLIALGGFYGALVGKKSI